MKVFSVIAVTVVLVAAVAYFQQRERRDGREAGPPPPRNPFLQLFDTDRNGEISTKEIENAATVLKKLDRDGNGALTRDELPRPPRRGDGREGGGRDGGPTPRAEVGRHERPEREEERENAPDGTIIFRGGYETDSRDHGRPVALIAAALRVKPEVFRQAFSNVNPSRGGGPSPERARANKKVLMDALGKHGVSNDRLDTVSNYYRYDGSSGEVWRRTPATAQAIVKNGQVTGFDISNPGTGYSTVPDVRVAGYGDVKVIATIKFSEEFKTNGSIASLSVVEDKK